MVSPRDLVSFLTGAGLALLVVTVVTGPFEVAAAAIFVLGCGLAYRWACSRLAR